MTSFIITLKKKKKFSVYIGKPIVFVPFHFYCRA